MSKKIEFLVACPTGIHIKPLTILVNEANRYMSDCSMAYNNSTVDLKSIMGTLALGVPANGRVKITIDGNDEQAAFDGIVRVLKEQDLM